MNDRERQTGMISLEGKAGSKPCDGCCDRCRKISDGVYVTPFFLSKLIARKNKGHVVERGAWSVEREK